MADRGEPAVDVALSDAGALTFANAAERAGVATAPQAYVVQWARFDNATGTATNVGDAVETSATTVTAPASLIGEARAGDVVQVAVAARHADHSTWAIPVTVHFRRAQDRWEPVGVRRLP